MLIGKLSYFNQITDKNKCFSLSDIDNMICQFSTCIQDIADPLFKKCVVRNSKNVIKNFDNKWFDGDCAEAKRLYKKAMYDFNNSKCTQNREHLCEKKAAYKRLIRKKKRLYFLRQSDQFTNLKSKNPKEFWNFFKQKKKDNFNLDNLVQDFETHFEDIFREISSVSVPEVEDFIEQSDFNINDPTFPELNEPITVSEVVKAIKRLKRNKASSPSDNILNEYLIESVDILSGHLTDMFNTIFDSGYFPESWSEGFIVPIHKKGDKKDPNNYRGVTLLSCLGKLFTSILNDRVNCWCSKHSKLSDSQFGFKKGHSTVDAMFVLSSLVDHVLNKNSRLYCAFVDFQKAFDSVYRNALWHKLFQQGLDGKILRIFRSMYNIVKSCVKCGNIYSKFFDISVGLRQGQINSPVMYALFIEDIELFLQDRPNCGLNFNDICLILLLFADDMVLIGHSVSDLQASLNRLHDYCSKWGMKINIDKTDIMVFRKRGRIKNNEKWFYGGKELKIVNNFNYLGVVFNHSGSFEMNNQYLIGKASKAMYTLLRNIFEFEVNPSISLQLFDAFVKSILGYGSPIWGFTKSKDIERLQMKFCKSVLGVKTSTSNAAVYGELSRLPLYIDRYVSIVKYWFKVISSDNILLQTAYNISLVDALNGKHNWVSRLKQLLFDYGFANVWESPFQYDNNIFINAFKQRIIDSFLQSWYSDVESSSVLSVLYKYIKPEFCYSFYLEKCIPRNFRVNLTRLRLSSHSLRVETGRYGSNRIPRSDRKCLCCNSGRIEDEFHFVLECEAFRNLRKQFLKPYFYRNPSMFKFTKLLNSPQRSNLVRLCQFISKAIKHRNTILLT